MHTDERPKKSKVPNATLRTAIYEPSFQKSGHHENVCLRWSGSCDTNALPFINHCVQLGWFIINCLANTPL